MGDHIDYKGLLINLCIKNKMTYEYREVLATGPSHDPRFTFHVLVNDEKLGEGQDKTKKAAANLAAKMAISVIQNRGQLITTLPQASQETPQSNPSSNAQNTSNAESPSSVIDDAKENAAQASPETPQSNPCSNVQNTSNAGTPPSVDAKENALETNYVGKFNELCQKKKWMHNSFLVERRGQPHIPEFFCRAVIGDKRFPEATGRSKQDAKKNAAFLALKELKREHPTDTEIPDVEEMNEIESASGNSFVSSSFPVTSPDLQCVQKGSSPASSGSEQSLPVTGRTTPIAPSRTQRRIELAPTFMNIAVERSTLTQDETLLRDFDDLTVLGEGGFGTVFKARKKLDEKYYVVKKVMFCGKKSVQEVKVLARLEHPNIVRYYHSWTGMDVSSSTNSSSSSASSDRAPGCKQECLFIQMELCENGTLKSWIERREKIHRNKSLAIFEQIVDGVEYIHSSKLIHRDLKPDNIFFATEHKIKIGDFGLVTYVTGEEERQALLRTHCTGTRSYMAPEQYEDAYENEVDIYSLGLILIELFIKFSTYHEKEKEWPKFRNAEFPQEFAQQFHYEESIIKLMLSKDPKKRPKALELKTYFGPNSLLSSKTR
ncbi:interferon-induced, double-stranded RNA-activated protein kinase-like [Spea bombifrons]|uniref:interferon-induced, double-stranded RNA-activated protein kinase-like n=1 Tax=Spea bombifrons TaxID=233779 RepID=UPI00234A60A8|nr:interferon-induced, double-stranded RNA-activated protein kinase-like [Spea bombifrons]